MSANQQVTKGLIDTQKLVDEIRVFLQAMDRTNSPRLRELSAQYAAACTEVDERLSRCFYFLRQGLRAEAIHLADSAPPLLELLSVLDFPERAEWEELTLQYEDWTRAPALAVESAQALNEAYAQEDPLKDLMRSHRLLALSRASLPERLAVLRKIARVDANNTIWQDDIRTFEKARLSQLGEEIRSASDNMDLDAMTAIEAELTQPDWIQQPSESQRQAVKAAAEALRRAAARSSLVETTNRLLEACASLDVATARKHRGRWKELARAAGISRTDPLATKAMPVLEWLEREDQREREVAAYGDALHDLEDALDLSTDKGDLGRLEQAVLDMNRELPPKLDERLREAVRAIDRKKRLIATGAAAACAGLLLAIGALVLWSNAQGQRKHAVEHAVLRIDKLTIAGQLAEARGTYDALLKEYPGADDESDVESALGRLETARKNEERRAARFRDELRTAKGDSALTPESPAFETLRKVATLPDELRALDDLLDQVRDRSRRIQAQSDDEAIRLADRFEPKLKNLEDNTRKDILSPATLNMIGDLKEDARRLNEIASRAGTQAHARANPLVERYEKIPVRRAARRRQIDAERKITDVVRGDMTPAAIDGFVRLCQEYRREFETSSRSQAFAEVEGEAGLWKAVASWNLLSDPWRRNLLDLKADEARVRQEQVEKFVAEYSSLPGSETVQEYKQYLQTVGDALDTRDLSPLRRILALLDAPEVAKVYILRDNSNRFFYSKNLPVQVGVRFEYTPLYAIRDAPAHIPLADIQAGYPQRSAQSRIAEEAKRAFDHMESWDRTMVSILYRIRQDKEIDPILQETLLLRIMKEASRGSFGLGRELDESVKILEDAKIDPNVDWSDPMNNAAIAVRRNARGAVAKLGQLDGLEREAALVRSRLGELLLNRDRPVGWLARDEEGNWQRRSPEAVKPDTVLWIAMPDGSWESAGRLGPDDRILGGGATGSRRRVLIEGRLLYARDAAR